MYKLVRPKQGKANFYTSRREGEAMKFVIGKAAKARGKLPVFTVLRPDVSPRDVAFGVANLCTDGVIHAYATLKQALDNHADHVGIGLWAVLKCSHTGIVANDGKKIGVRSLTPVAELGVFDSLTQKSHARTLARVKDEREFKRLAKVKKLR